MLNLPFHEAGIVTSRTAINPDGTPSGYWSYEYNEYGDNTVQTAYDADHNELSRIVREYDENHQVVSESTYTEGTLSKKQSMHSYVNNNRTESEVYDQSEALIGKVAQTTDSDGNVSETLSYNTEGVLQYTIKYIQSDRDEFNENAAAYQQLLADISNNAGAQK